MNTTLKKKNSGFYLYANRPKVTQLVKRLSQSYENSSQAAQIYNILEKRKKKLRELRKFKSRQLYQELPMKPAKMIECFSTEKPISSGEEFLLEKYKTCILDPDRASNSQPNLKTGSSDKKNHSCEQDSRVMNRKFLQYIQKVEEQSGVSKRKRLQANFSLPSVKSPQKTSMKKTYFKKYQSDRFNFYKPPITEITRIFDLTDDRQSLETSRSLIKSIKLAKKYKTIDINSIQTESTNL